MEEGYDRVMKVRIGISTTDKVIELEVDDAKKFKADIERSLAEGGMGWFADSKGRSVGIPATSVAFIEIEDSDATRRVGFSPG